MNLIFLTMHRKEEIKTLLKGAIETEMTGRSYEAFIFGSQANCSELKSSDIDIGIITSNGLGAKTYTNLLERIDNLPMLYMIDLVDFNEVNDDFKSVALKNIERL